MLWPDPLFTLFNPDLNCRVYMGENYHIVNHSQGYYG